MSTTIACGDAGAANAIWLLERTGRWPRVGIARRDVPLELDSKPGRGSVFRLWLERKQPSAEAAGAPKSTALQGCVVVLVDDDLAVLGATREVLESWGCRVVAATSAAEAREAIALRGLSPDVILADYRLGELDTGLDAIAAVRADCGLVQLVKPIAPARTADRADARYVPRGNSRPASAAPRSIAVGSAVEPWRADRPRRWASPASARQSRWWREKPTGTCSLEARPQSRSHR